MHIHNSKKTKCVPSQNNNGFLNVYFKLLTFSDKSYKIYIVYFEPYVTFYKTERMIKMMKQKATALFSAAALALNILAVFPAYVSAEDFSTATISLESILSEKVDMSSSDDWFGTGKRQIFGDENSKNIIVEKIKEKTGDTPDKGSMEVTDITLSYSITTTGNVTDYSLTLGGSYQDSSYSWHDVDGSNLDVSASSVNLDTLWSSENCDKYDSIWIDFGGCGEEGSSISLDITDMSLNVRYIPLKHLNVTGTETYEVYLWRDSWAEWGLKSVTADADRVEGDIWSTYAHMGPRSGYFDFTTIEDFASKYNKITATFKAVGVKSNLRAKIVFGDSFATCEFPVTEGVNTITATLTNDITYSFSDLYGIGIAFFSDTATEFTLCSEKSVFVSGDKTLSGNYFNDSTCEMKVGRDRYDSNLCYINGCERIINATWRGDLPNDISFKDFAEQYGSIDFSFIASDIVSDYGNIAYKIGFSTDRFKTFLLNDKEPIPLKSGLNTVKMDISGTLIPDGTVVPRQLVLEFDIIDEDGNQIAVPEGVDTGTVVASFNMSAVPVSVTGTDTLDFLPEADTLNAVVFGEFRDEYRKLLEGNTIVYSEENGNMPEDFPADFTEMAAKYGKYTANMTVENLKVADGITPYGRFVIVEDAGANGMTRTVGERFEIKEGKNKLSVIPSELPAAGNIREFGIVIETEPSYINNLGFEDGSCVISFDYSFAEDKPQIIEAVAGDGQVALTWTPIEDAENYAVYQYLNKKWILSDTTEDTSITINDLTNGVQYGFAVKAYVNGKWTSVSSEDIVYATPAGNAKPQITKTVPGDGQVALNWTEVKGAKNYAVFTYINKKWTLAGTTTALGKYVKGLTNGVKYGFAVKAYVNGKWTSITSEDIVYASPIGAAKPVITKAEAGDKQVILNWTPVTGAGKYAVYTYLNGKWTLVGTRSVTGMYVKNLTNGFKYGFAVKAYVNGKWTSVTTKDIVYATPVSASAKPKITKTIIGNGQVGLNWTAVNGAAQYAVYYKYNGVWTLAGTTTAQGKYVRGLKNGVTYGFAVKAYVNGAWTAISSSDIVYAAPSAAKASLETDITDIEFTDIEPEIKF